MPTSAPKHRPLRPLAPRHQVPERNRQAGRQYATNSATWRRLREQVLARDLYTCRDCHRISARKGEAHVDHDDGDPWNNDMANLVTRCAPCHAAKTARQDGGYGNARRQPSTTR